jgi:hypothetical protein
VPFVHVSEKVPVPARSIVTDVRTARSSIGSSRSESGRVVADLGASASR